LNLRPPGYEPGELPDCSTPRRGDKDSIASMPWWTWVALVFFVLVVLAGTAVTFVSLRRMRRLQAAGNDVALALDELTRKTEGLEKRLEVAAERTDLVERKLAHLNASLERLSVLTWALGDVAKAVSELRSSVLLKK
jgi:hypothetical protein